MSQRNSNQYQADQPNNNFVIDNDEPTDTSYNQEAGDFRNEPGEADAQYDPHAPQSQHYGDAAPPFAQPYDEHGQPYNPPDLYDEHGQPFLFDPNNPFQQPYSVHGQPYHPPPLYDEHGNPYDLMAQLQAAQQQHVNGNNDYNDDGNYDDLPPVDNSAYDYDGPIDEEEQQQQRQYQQEPAPEQAQQPPTPPERQHKYSTANLDEDSKCKKYMSICCLFLLFLAVMIGLSMLFNHFFFDDKSDNGPAEHDQRDPNSTFPQDKQDIDGACSRSTYRLQPELCEESCVPMFFKCCDPFDEFNLYNYTQALTSNSTNSTDNVEEGYEPGRSSRPSDVSEKNFTFLEGYEDWEPSDGSVCQFDADIRGCMAYAKCHVLTGQIDAAPANLPEMCALEQLSKDPQTCQAMCRPLECCYSTDSDNCLAEKFDLCVDYAPCQNMRSLAGHEILETAPRTLDYDCYEQLPTCTETCKKAECCSNPKSSCFQLNFMSCLTYAPCNNVTLTSITVGPQFNKVAKPPKDIIYACNAANEEVLEPTEKTCEEYCNEAACCWSGNSEANCFFHDPLGCMAWEAQCQVLLDKKSMRHEL